MWADSHSYWSYYFIVPIITAIILFLDTKQKIFNDIYSLDFIKFCYSIFFNSKTILEIKQKPLSNETVSFINKYSNCDYVSNDNSIGFGFGFG